MLKGRRPGNLEGTRKTKDEEHAEKNGKRHAQRQKKDQRTRISAQFRQAEHFASPC